MEIIEFEKFVMNLGIIKKMKIDEEKIACQR